MHLPSVIQILAATIISLVTGSTAASVENINIKDMYIEKDYYMKSIAPDTLQRISALRATQKKWTSSQNVVFDLAEQMVKNYEIDRLQELRSKCHAVFGDDCVNLLVGQQTTSGKQKQMAPGGKLLLPDCECNYYASWCWVGKCVWVEGTCNKKPSKFAKYYLSFLGCRTLTAD